MNNKETQSEKDLKHPCHRSYLLRLWRAYEDRGFNWRASLDIPETSERIGFANLEELFAYLMNLTTSYELDNKETFR